MQFSEAEPERHLSEIPAENMRRHELHKICLEKGFLTLDQPTPPKTAMVLMVTANMGFTQAQIDRVSNPKSVPLSEAHKEQTVESLDEEEIIREISALQNLLASKENVDPVEPAPVEERPVLTLAEAPAMPEQPTLGPDQQSLETIALEKSEKLIAFMSMKSTMAKAKYIRDNHEVNMPKSATAEQLIELYKEIIDY